MKIQNTSSNIAFQTQRQFKPKTTNATTQSSQLMKLFEDELKDIFWAEKALTKAIPKMIRSATSIKLIETLSMHLDETHEQVERLTKVFASIGKLPVAKKCEAMEGLLNEAEAILYSSEAGSMCDAGIILTGQKIEHYEIASYGTLCAFAKTLGEVGAAALLQHSLDEEKEADIRLSVIAHIINVEAANEVEEE